MVDQLKGLSPVRTEPKPFYLLESMFIQNKPIMRHCFHMNFSELLPAAQTSVLVKPLLFSRARVGAAIGQIDECQPNMMLRARINADAPRLTPDLSFLCSHHMRRRVPENDFLRQCLLRPQKSFRIVNKSSRVCSLIGI